MNNKQLGTEFEQEVCRLLAQDGFWAHFIVPDARGAQPFDIVAVKNGRALAIDCKTSAKKIFPISRLEDNQIMAFEKWVRCGNEMPLVYVKYSGRVYVIEYDRLQKEQKIDLSSEHYLEGVLL